MGRTTLCQVPCVSVGEIVKQCSCDCCSGQAGVWRACVLSVCAAVPNQDVCQLHNALEELNQPQDFPSTFALPKLCVCWIFWENDTYLRWKMHWDAALFSGIIIITDGVTSVPDVAVCETLLNQLRSGTVACSFVQVWLLLPASVGTRGRLVDGCWWHSPPEKWGPSLPVSVLDQPSALFSALLFSLRYPLYPSHRWAVSTPMIAALAMFPTWNWWNSLPWPLLVLTSPRALSWIPWAWIWMYITRHFCCTPFCVLGSPWIQNITVVRNVHVLVQ